MLSQSIPTLFAFAVVTATLANAQQVPAPADVPSQTETSVQPRPEPAVSEPAANSDELTPDREEPKAPPSAESQIKAALDVLTTVLEQYRKSGNRLGEA